MTTLLLVILAVVATVFWLTQLLSLMAMPDDRFPGRYDKPIWAVILLVLSVLGAVLFVIWKASVRAEEESAAVAGLLGGTIQRAKSNRDATQPPAGDDPRRPRGTDGGQYMPP